MILNSATVLPPMSESIAGSSAGVRSSRSLSTTDRLSRVTIAQRQRRETEKTNFPLILDLGTNLKRINGLEKVVGNHYPDQNNGLSNERLYHSAVQSHAMVA